MKTESEVRRGTATRRAAPSDRGVRSGREAVPERLAEAPGAPGAAGAAEARAGTRKPRPPRGTKPVARQAAETERVPSRQASAPSPRPDAARTAKVRTADVGEGRTRVTRPPKPQPKPRPKARPTGGGAAPASAGLANAPAPARPRSDRTGPAKPPRSRRVSSAGASATRTYASARYARAVPPRTPFVLLLVGLLCGGLITLLLLNTVLAQDSFRLGELREQIRVIGEQSEKMRNKIARLDSPGSIASRSEQHGDRPDKSPPQFVTPAP
ncbi:hypothetical protein AB0K60_23150 [Thermopolyspora sp. NPDC052614]|uniref:hypothetical protein n=1 Tax=Thermopolyspora sp. NPDC052614 TaxID=3155682 RepID=UPI0034446FA7